MADAAPASRRTTHAVDFVPIAQAIIVAGGCCGTSTIRHLTCLTTVHNVSLLVVADFSLPLSDLVAD
jgi:hypothetical protein